MMLAEWLVEKQTRERDGYGERSADLEEHQHDAKRQRGTRYLSSAQRAIADVAEPRLARLKQS